MVRRVYGKTPTSLRRPGHGPMGSSTADSGNLVQRLGFGMGEIGPFMPDRRDGPGAVIGQQRA